MDRRALLQTLGATTALAAMPRSVEAIDTLASRLHASLQQQQSYRALSRAQLVTVERVADLVIPRTDTPGALDVQVPALIDLLLAEWFTPEESRKLLNDIDALDVESRSLGATSFVALVPDAQRTLLTQLDARRDEKEGAAAGFRELKALTIFGYFTSERVTKDILRTRMSFPRYQGDAPVGT